MTVQIDLRLLEMAEGCEVLNQLKEAEINYRIGENNVPGSIKFFRKDILSGQVRLFFNSNILDEK